MYSDSNSEDQNFGGRGSGYGGSYQGDANYEGQYGYNYRNYRPNDSLKGKVEQKYWKTKQKVIEKLGKNQDEFVIAGDAEVDARLEAFKHIQMTCMHLMSAVETYQNRIFGLSQDENEMGRFLRDQGSQDKTKAGKMMIAVGKAQSYAAQQRLSLRVPLVRLYQEIETFKFRAISDTAVTVRRMETSRSEYRAGMLWMADVSKELDPDVNKRLDRFRDVQSQVKANKKQFDKLKYDVLQKIDLLSASRCNLLSATLAAYQTTMLKFLEQTARSYQTVSEQFKGHPSYQFQVLKHIIPNNGIVDSDDEEGTESAEGASKSVAGIEEATDIGNLEDRRQTSNRDREEDDSKLISFDMSPIDDENRPNPPKAVPQTQAPAENDASLLGFFHDAKEETSPGFGDFEASGPEDPEKETKDFEELLKNFKQPVSSRHPASNAASADDGMLLGDLLGDEAGSLASLGNARRPAGNAASASGSVDELLFGTTGDFPNAPSDDMDLLNDILSSASLGDSATEPGSEASFSSQWQAMFGSGDAGKSRLAGPQSIDPAGDNLETTTQSSSMYMPSFLMDQMRKVDPVAAEKGIPTAQGAASAKKGSSTPTMKKKALEAAATKKQQDMSAWFNLFSDLDPLSNPDAIGKDKTCDEERSC